MKNNMHCLEAEESVTMSSFLFENDCYFEIQHVFVEYRT